MDIYFNKYGVCTTQIYNGEVVRQGSTFNINVYFDEDFDSTDVLATISFLRPGDAAFSSEFNFDKSKLDYFTKQDNREISSDLVDGKQYRVFKYTTLDTEEITMYYGKLVALITIYRRGDIYVQSRVVVDVEPTTGNINKTITKNQYEYLTTLQTKVSTALDEVLGEEESQKADQQLEKIVDTKKDIKNALEEKGQAPSKRFDTYANIIRKNLASVSGEVNITENGSYDVSNYASANVNVEQGVFPEGEIKITENGNYDVTNYANASVNIVVDNVEIITNTKAAVSWKAIFFTYATLLLTKKDPPKNSKRLLVCRSNDSKQH